MKTKIPESLNSLGFKYIYKPLKVVYNINYSLTSGVLLMNSSIISLGKFLVN